MSWSRLAARIKKERKGNWRLRSVSCLMILNELLSYCVKVVSSNFYLFFMLFSSLTSSKHRKDVTIETVLFCLLCLIRIYVLPQPAV